MAGAKRNEKRSRSYRAAEAEAGYHAVCLIGYETVVPRYMGDNLGVWPVRVAMSKKPRDAAKRPDIESPVHRITVLDFVMVETEAHARILKAKMDELLLGASHQDRALRHGWRDIEADPSIVWPVLLGQALEELAPAGSGRRGRATRFEVFGEAEAVRRIERRAGGKIW